MQAFRNPVMVNGFEINVTISIGAGMFPSCGEDKISLMKNTNIALHSAKRWGKTGFNCMSLGWIKIPTADSY